MGAGLGPNGTGAGVAVGGLRAGGGFQAQVARGVDHHADMPQAVVLAEPVDHVEAGARWQRQVQQQQIRLDLLAIAIAASPLAAVWVSMP